MPSCLEPPEKVCETLNKKPVNFNQVRRVFPKDIKEGTKNIKEIVGKRNDLYGLQDLKAQV